MTKKLLRDVRMKSGQTFAKGTSFDILFLEKNGRHYLEAHQNGTIAFKTTNFTVFFRAPSMTELEEWMSDSICETVTGDSTEPDGTGPDGAPSWLLALGLI